MKKLTFGTPEKFLPSRYCRSFRYTETEIRFPVSDISFRETAAGVVLEFPVENDTEFFGAGLQFRQFNHTGRKLRLKCNADPRSPAGDTHAPVPFFVTNKGYGMYIDAARDVEFYFGLRKACDPVMIDGNEPALSTDELYGRRAFTETAYCAIYIPHVKGADVYIMEGGSITDIVAQYNMLAGGGCAVSDWSLGVVYRTNGGYSADEVLKVADYMRNNRIPCDVIGLEPGWQTHAYPCTYVWDPCRFPDPEGFVRQLRENGFHLNLWEHAYVHPDSPIHDAIYPYCGEYRVFKGLVPDFALPEARDIFSAYQKTLVKAGIDGFKADECDGSDHTGGWSFPDYAVFPSGLDGEQYHHLFGVLYAQTMHAALDNAPCMSEIRSMGALAASYPFVLYSDLYDHKDFIRAAVNAGFSGLLWAPEFRFANSREEVLRRLQTAVFSVHCLINAWSNPQIPWIAFDCVDEVRDLLEERERLVPKLLQAFHRYQETGVPPVRALVMDYSDDPETYHIDDEYMFCDDLLVAPIVAEQHGKRRVYLPAGQWADYYTDRQVRNGWFEVETEKIPVYRRIDNVKE